MSDMELDKLSPYGRFLHHCAQGELAFQRTTTGKALFFPRLINPDDSQSTPQWSISTGLGEVHSVTLVCHRNENPFALALVELDEGFRMMSRIDTDNPERVAIGARVKVAFRSLGDKQPVLPVFNLLEDVS